MLTKEQILFIIERISEETVVEPTENFPYRISRRRIGYSDDKKVGTIQAMLSIMLEMADK